MENKNYTTTLLVEQTAKETFNAITNVRGWWSEGLEGNSQKLNDEFIYEHKPYHRSRQKLIEVVSDKKIVWLVTESKLSFLDEPSEWIGTKICFEIFNEGVKNRITFTHKGLVPKIECYKSCTSAWTQYMEKLAGKLR